jgi:hypothetical protein
MAVAVVKGAMYSEFQKRLIWCSCCWCTSDSAPGGAGGLRRRFSEMMRPFVERSRGQFKLDSPIHPAWSTTLLSAVCWCAFGRRWDDSQTSVDRSQVGFDPADLENVLKGGCETLRTMSGPALAFAQGFDLMFPATPSSSAVCPLCSDGERRN